MTLFFVSTFFVSLLGMATILGLKHREMTTGSLYFGTLRPRISLFFRHLTVYTKRTLPLAARENRHRAAEMASVLGRYMLAQIAKGVEYVLEKVLHIVRKGTTIERTPGEASPFLREVSDHKRQLVRDDAREYLE